MASDNDKQGPREDSAPAPEKARLKPKKPRDPAKPTRAKANRPDFAPTGPDLEKLLNPGIHGGTAGPGPSTGIRPPADNSKDRRADFSAAHTARASTQGFGESPQPGYGGSESTPLAGIDPELAKALGFDGTDAAPSPPSPAGRGGKRPLAPHFITGASATVRALEQLLREGRPEFAGKPWTPHRPERPEKSEGGRRLVIQSEFEPKGDQPQAIEELVKGVRAHERTQVLLGVTGSGKTFTMAKVIEATQRPALILAPNKTLAAHLYGEFRSFFPDNAVEYFVSYYDYYQPEAYIPQSDTYIEKDALINDEIDRMRHSTTTSLFERRDVVVVASVSCIYGIGEPETYHGMHVALRGGQTMDRDALIRGLVAIQYERNDYDFRRGTFRVRGDVVEIFPAAAEAEA